MTSNVRLSRQTVELLASLSAKSSAWYHGYSLSQETGLASGTLYPILMRLEEHGWLETKWESPPPGGRPPRHLYRLTASGRAGAAEAVHARKARRAIRLAPQKA